jgi:hypothetical protein
MRLGFLRIIHIRGPPVYRFEFDSPLRELKEGSRLRHFPPSDGAPVWNSLRFRKPRTEFDALRARQFSTKIIPIKSIFIFSVIQQQYPPTASFPPAQ